MTHRFGETDSDDGVVGISKTGRGIVGMSTEKPGVFGVSENAQGVWGETKANGRSGVVGVSDRGDGVTGESKADRAGVVGRSERGPGVVGQAEAAGRSGVVGKSEQGDGVTGESKADRAGVVGRSERGPGVVGQAEAAGRSGVVGESERGAGVTGESKSNYAGVVGRSTEGPGVWGVSELHEGVHAETKSPAATALTALNLNPLGTGAAIYAKKEGSIGHAAFFDGDVHVTRSVMVEGDVMLQNADCAEEFSVVDPELAQPGTVMVINEDGDTVPCTTAYDHCVIGVISGAGDYRPALLLDRQGGTNRRPIALMGKVFCRVDASYGAIRPGDLLTTSATIGHAMRASDAARSPGAMIGKALAGLSDGQGLIPVLAMLQ